LQHIYALTSDIDTFIVLFRSIKI